MTILKERMLADMQLRGLAEKTQKAYLRAVRQLWPPITASPLTRLTKRNCAATFSFSRMRKKHSAAPAPSPFAASSSSWLFPARQQPQAAQSTHSSGVQRAFKPALAAARQAAELQKQNGYRSGVLFALQARGTAEFVMGRHSAARATLATMQQLSREIGGMYAYIPMFLSLLLAPESLDDFAQRFQWLEFTRTTQNAKAITNNFLKAAS